MYTSDHHITTLVTNRQALNHQASDLLRHRKGDNRDMLKNRIKELRKGKDWSLDKLAEITGISKQHLHRLETYHPNARLNESNMKQLCDAFGISVGELFGEKISKQEDKISQADIAITQVLQAVLSILLKKKHILPNEVESILTQASDLYRVHHLPNAVTIVDGLRNSLTGEVRTSEQEVIHKLLELAPLGAA
jgi:transcriptional regulator with XRE-family HTH domain